MWTSSWLLFLPLVINHALAQNISSLPQCGQNCFNVVFNEFGRSCPTRDAACLCSQPGFNPDMTSCTSQQCVSQTDSATVLAFVQSYCAPANQSTTVTVTPTTRISMTMSNTTVVSQTTAPTMTQAMNTSGGTATASAIVATKTSNAGVTIGASSGMALSVMIMSLLSLMFPL